MTFKRDDTYSFSRSKSGEVTIFHFGESVTVLRGQVAEKFTRRIDGAANEQAQQVMARITGNFKRGNEKGR